MQFSRARLLSSELTTYQGACLMSVEANMSSFAHCGAETRAAAAAAEAAAERLGLAYERRFTGYGDLGTTLAKL